jgi:hypothetical protein
MPTYSPATPLSSSQLTAASQAAGTHGVPVNIVRSVTAFKYGSASTSADFDYVAGQLANSYKQAYLQSGNTLVAWQKAAEQEMGPAASHADVLLATAAQSTAITGMITAPAVAAAAAGAAAEAAAAGEAGAAGETAAGDAGATAESGADSAATKATGSAAAKALGGGLAGLLGLSGGEALIARALEALVGFALILLGLQALSGTGSQGNPVAAVRSVGSAGKYFL